MCGDLAEGGAQCHWSRACEGKASDQEQKAAGARSVKAFRQWQGAQSPPNVVGATERQGARVHLSLLLTAA